jgi:hypothetical protein
MPRATGTREPPPVLTPPEPPPPSLEELADDEEYEDIESVIGQIGDDGATVTIRRRSTEDRTKWDYLTVLPAREFSLELIKREYGGGEYKAQTFDRNKRFVRGGTRLFNIDKMFKPTAAATPAAPLAAAAPSAEVQALTAKLDALAAAVAAQNSTKETLNMALQIATVMNGGRNGAPGMSPDTIFNTATRLIEFSRGLGGEHDGGGEHSNDDDVYATAIKELVKPVAALLQTEIERRRGTTPPPKQITAGGTPPAPGGGMANAPQWAAALAPFVPQLLTLAKEQADPELYADVVYDLMTRKLTAAQLSAVEEAAKADDFVQTVLRVLPAPCKPYTEWFTALTANLKAAMTAPPNPGEDDNDDDDGPVTPG